MPSHLTIAPGQGGDGMMDTDGSDKQAGQIDAARHLGLGLCQNQRPRAANHPLNGSGAAGQGKKG
ncbi:hypothetical protein TRIUR3_12793 [Triticum urartu]|uniref:Uncharacterized protein n=1 Tax=Triticum urartu TaxID=4572 RepID=M7ZB51_TRIUA|nr:hypothetical protein TRIUR3_12793 [Triticum urartu]